MSGAIKKVFKSVKKVFKKIVKVVKKILKSKIFKIVLIAVAIYFTGGAALGALSSMGAAAGGAAAAGTAAAGTAAATTGAAAATASGASALATGAAATGTAATTATASGGLLSTLGGSKMLLASTALNVGGSLMKGKADESAEKEERKRLEINNSTDIDVYGRTQRALDDSGWGRPTEEATEAQQTNGITQSARQNVAVNESNSALAGVGANVQESFNKAPVKAAPKFYNNADNKWQKVSVA